MKTIVETILKSSDFNDKMVITISHQGFIERTPLVELRSLIHENVGIKAFYTKNHGTVL